MAENRPLTLVDFVEKYSDKFSRRTFLREKVNGVWTETSFADTRSESRLIAAGFMALGLKKSDKVSILSEGRNKWIFAELGILYAGGINVPLSFKLDSDVDLIFRINHSEARFVVVSESQIEKIRRVKGQCPGLEKVIVMDNIPLQDNEILMSEVRSLGENFIRLHSGELERRMASIAPDDYANISYTSGTTSDPKGVLLTHRNYTVNVEQCRSVVFVAPKSVMLIILPLDHCFAHVAGFYYMMAAGGSIATVPCGRSVVTMLRNIPDTIKEVRPHLMLTVPALMRNFKKSIDAQVKARGPLAEKLYNYALHNATEYNREYYNAGRPASKLAWRRPLMAVNDRLIFSRIRRNFGGRLQYFIGGGARLDIDLQRYFCAIGMPVFQGYGLSEAAPVVASNFQNYARFGSVGRTAQPMEVRICDESGAELPDGQTGEIVVRGDNVMAGYWKNPEATEKVLIGGWLHTGDRGYLCPEDNRYLYVNGRFKSLLIGSDGEKYSPEGYEDSLVVNSKFIDGAMLYNNQSTYTSVLVVPAKKALATAVEELGMDPRSEDGIKAQLDLIREDVDSYREGGSRTGMFPEKWLPATIIVADEAFTERNGMVNSTSKMVRGKVEERFRDRIAYALTPEGKHLYNQQNINSLK